MTLLYAVVSAIAAAALHIQEPSKFHAGSYIVYGLLAATVSSLVLSTGGASSVFVGLFVAVMSFAAVFGGLGITLGIALLAGFTTVIFRGGNDIFSAQFLVFILLLGAVPLAISFLLFRRGSDKPDAAKHSLHELHSELAQETNKSSTVIRAISEGVIAVDAKGVIELINPAAQQIIGWGGADAVGLDYKSVMKLSDRADAPLSAATDPVSHVLSTNKDIQTKEYFVTTGAGKRIATSIVVSPIGQLGEGAIIVFRNITKEQAEEREQAEFISTASHEMRTPVASIEGYLGLALNPNTAQIDTKARDFITKAHESAQHLGRLFQDLLDVSKAEDGRLSNHPKIVDVVAYIGQVCEGLRPKAEAKQLRLFFKPGLDTDDQRTISPVFYANVDSDHLRELVSNLIENAIKYTPSGDVIIDITGDEDHVRISVQDSGIGIPKEDMPHLFQKFYRVDNTATREIGGTGLGLYLCRRLSEVMGGRLWAESEFKKGSTFYLELQRTPREEAMRLIDAASTELEARPIEIDPVPAAPAPLPVSSTAPAPTVPQPQATVAPPSPQQVETQPTLAAIEQNPAAYTQPRESAGISIPERR